MATLYLMMLAGLALAVLALFLMVAVLVTNSDDLADAGQWLVALSIPLTLPYILTCTIKLLTGVPL